MFVKYRYVTIEREFGSGGRLVASELSKKCNIPYYGREILNMVAEEYDIPVERVEKFEENSSNSFLYSVYMMSQPAGNNAIVNESNLHIAEHKIIKKISADGPAIFLGHCAAQALSDRNGVLRVFIKADDDVKKERCLKEYNIGYDKIDSVIKKFNKRRANYYEMNTAVKWKDEANYDLVLDSGKLGIDGCVAAIAGLLSIE